MMLAGSGLKALAHHHPTEARILLLAGIFASGWLDAKMKLRDLACATWAFGLFALVFWLALSSTLGLVIAPVVCVAGLVLGRRSELHSSG